MNKTFDPIDILFILLISCYLVCFTIIVIYIIRNKKINIKEFFLKKTIKKTVSKKKMLNNSKKTFSPQPRKRISKNKKRNIKNKKGKRNVTQKRKSAKKKNN